MPDIRFQRIDTATLPCLMTVPEGTPPPSGWPLLCFLHGYGEAAPLPIEQGLTRHGPWHEAVPGEIHQRFIIIAPQLPQAGDYWKLVAGDVEVVVRRALLEQQGDPSRCYLCGFSFGGNGVFDIALSQPGQWAALWTVDPTRAPQVPLPHPLWVSIGQVTRRLQARFIQTLHLQPVTEEEPSGERLYLDEGADHVNSARLAFADRRIYAWLLRHRSAG
ncbi:hypothetical protein [Stutzerimonas nosocomialis]|nr:hypothetical protein [Stutzerimonas nosocomialis]